MTRTHDATQCNSASRTPAFDVLHQIPGCSVERFSVDRVKHPLTNASFSCIGGHSSKLFKLIQVPQDGSITSSDTSAYVTTGYTVLVFKQISEYFSAQGIDAQQGNHANRLGRRGCGGLNIAWHPPILSHRVLISCHCTTKCDTLTRRVQIKQTLDAPNRSRRIIRELMGAIARLGGRRGA